MRGRRPKPTRLKMLTGNPGKRPLNGNEPRPAAAVPDVLRSWGPSRERSGTVLSANSPRYGF